MSIKAWCGQLQHCFLKMITRIILYSLLFFIWPNINYQSYYIMLHYIAVGVSAAVFSDLGLFSHISVYVLRCQWEGLLHTDVNLVVWR